jgi:uncharacterized Fe-S cluster protein YjdI
MENPSSKEYTNGEVVVTWQPEKCIHSGKCVRGLPSVFDPKKRPWITPEDTDSQALVDQINKCPSGALGYYFKDK